MRTGSLWRRMVAVIRKAAARFAADRAGRMALAIAYRTLFALAPLLLISTAIAGFMFRREETLSALIENVSDFLGQAGVKVVEDAIAATTESAPATGLIGLALLLWTGSGLFIEIRQSLNDIFREADDVPGGLRSFVWTRVSGLAAVVAVGILVIAMVALNLAVTAAGRFVDERLPWFTGVVRILIPLVSLVVLAVVLALQFQWFTTRRLPWRAAWWGGAVTAAILVVAGLGIGWYIGTRDGLTAGALTGGAVIALFLVAGLAQAYLFGAEITRVIADEAP